MPVLDGVAQLKVPAGAQNGDVLRLRGKGMPGLHGRGRGDACYTVVVEVPKKLSGSSGSCWRSTTGSPLARSWVRSSAASWSH